MKKMSLFILTISLTSACATNSKSRWAMMGAAAPVGGVIGYSTAPDDEKPEAHAFLWSAVFVAAAAIIGNYLYSDDKELSSLRAENQTLKTKPNFELISENEEKFYVPSGTVGEYKKGKYKVKKIDVWVDDGPNAKIHQDLRLELNMNEKSKDKKSEK